MPCNFVLSFIRDDDFLSYLKENHLSKEDYFNPDAPKAVLLNTMCSYVNGKYYTYPLFSSYEDSNITLHLPREREDYDSFGTFQNAEGKWGYSYIKDSSNESLDLAPEECCLMLPITIGAALTSIPKNADFQDQQINLYYPYSMIDSVFAGLEEGVRYVGLPDERPISQTFYPVFNFQAKEHKEATSNLETLLDDMNMQTELLYDASIWEDQEKALITVVNVFSYGFITLISLIAAANVFNTISTNIILRKREFAMLKSIGLSPDGFQKMMNFECLLYGFKGLLYGLPVSVFITWLIHRAISDGLEMKFFIPWYSLVIAVGSVFLVVFSTMLYSTHKIKRENIMDTLKDENI